MILSCTRRPGEATVHHGTAAREGKPGSCQMSVDTSTNWPAFYLHAVPYSTAKAAGHWVWVATKASWVFQKALPSLGAPGPLFAD